MSDQLTGEQYKKLGRALVKAFPTKSKLEQMLKFGLDVDLNGIASGDNLNDIIFQVIRTLESRGKLNDLIAAAGEHNPHFKTLYKDAESSENTPIEITKEYIKYIEDNYGKLFVLGQANLKPIDEIYTALNLLGKLTAQRRYARDNLHDLFLERHLLYEEHERCDGIELVNKGSNLFILGKPGAGKTTFLKHVAIKAVRNELNPNVEQKIPIFISLHSHSRSGNKVIESVRNELAGCGFPEDNSFVKGLLHSGRALVLFDGLDEVREEDNLRSETIQELKGFMKDYSQSQFIISCRVAATEYSFENVDYVEMADFDETQIKTFVTNWFHENKEVSENCWKELNDRENKGLWEMGRVPLLLGLLCLTYEEVRYFPQRRVEVYEEAIDALLKQWDNKRNIQRDKVYKFLALGRKRQLLNHIAATSFEEGEFLIEKGKLANVIKAYMQKMPDVKEEVDGEVIINAIAAQHGMFVERAYKLYSFAHLSFQEYFVAKYIVDKGLKSLKRLLVHINHDQWREIFLLTISLLEQEVADEFFKLFSKATEEIAAQNEDTRKLLVWANNKANHAQETIGKYEKYALRFWYAYLTRVLAHDPNRALDLDLALELAHDRALDLALTLAHDLDRVLARDLDLVLARARALARARTLDHARDLDRDLDRVLDHALDRALTCDLDLAYYYTERSIEKARELNYKTIQERLSRLLNDKLSSDQIILQLKEIHEEFHKVSNLHPLYILNNFDIEFINSLNWSKDFASNINNYLQANQLLVDCLELAFVSDKQSILDQLALPASEAST